MATLSRSSIICIYTDDKFWFHLIPNPIAISIHCKRNPKQETMSKNVESKIWKEEDLLWRKWDPRWVFWSSSIYSSFLPYSSSFYCGIHSLFSAPETLIIIQISRGMQIRSLTRNQKVLKMFLMKILCLYWKVVWTCLLWTILHYLCNLAPVHSFVGISVARAHISQHSLGGRTLHQLC